MNKILAASLLGKALLSLSLWSSAGAQIPPGDNVVSLMGGTVNVGPSGLFRVDRHTGNATAITGLPPTVSAPAPYIGGFGPSFVRRYPDGRLVTCGSASPGAQAHVYIFELSGDHVIATESFAIGEALVPNARVDEGVIDPSTGWIVIGVDPTWLGVPSDPLYGHHIGVIDTANGDVHPIPAMGMMAGTVTALQLDASQTYLVAAVHDHSISMTRIYTVPYPSGGIANEIYATSGNVRGALNAPGGHMWLAWNGQFTGGQQQTGIAHLNTQTGVLTAHSTGSIHMGDLIIEPSSGDFIAASVSSPQLILVAADGTSWSAMSTTFQGSVVTGVANAPVFREYGQADLGANTYEWQTTPNPGGFPSVGNASFSLTVASSPGTALIDAALVSLNPATAPVTVHGINVLVDPNTVMVGWQAPGGGTMTVPLPIPNIPSLTGFGFAAQTIHLEASGQFATSRGLLGTIR